jgi:hypothetical protein
MIIVNSKILDESTTDSGLKEYAREYRDGVMNLKNKFPTGTIQLQRNGYPMMNVSLDPNMPSLPEIPPPIFIKLTKTVNGVTWGYCKGKPYIQANGLADVPETENAEKIDGEVISIDLRNRPDYAFFIMFKSGILGTHYHVFDPEGDKIRELEAKNAKLKVQYAIRETLTEEKLRMIASAWGVIGAEKKNLLIVQDELETKVFAMDEDKNKNRENLSLKGVSEFLAEIKNDEVTRPKAIIQLAIDEGKLKFDGSNSHFYFNGGDVCYVPVDKQDIRVEVLAKFLRDENNKDVWIGMLKSLIDADYINSTDKFGKRWLASQLGLPLNKKEEEITKALLAEFTQG